jgi:2-hydroxychromene-2-carboxylate isomerase
VKAAIRKLAHDWQYGQRAIEVRRAGLELRRLLTLRPREAIVFLQLDDPYSYLLVHYLAFLMPQYNTKVRFRFLLCQALSGEYSPRPDLLAEYALRDCTMLARELGVPFLDVSETPPVELRRQLLDFLANEQEESDFADSVTKAFAFYWRGDAEGLARFLGRVRSDGSDTHVLIGKNQLLLRRMGHYRCASIFYAGDWYLGIDRLHYLVARLNARKLNRYKDAAPQLASLLQSMQLRLPAAPPVAGSDLPPMALFYSPLDPHSYLALCQALIVSRAFGVDLNIRIVASPTPAAMPESQRRYLLADAIREAERLSVPFGYPVAISCPDRLLPACYYAQSQMRGHDFLMHLGKALFVEGLDASTDEVMKALADQSGLFWPELQASLTNMDWQRDSRSNEEAMLAAGHWSTPLMKVGELAWHGHDRDWLLARYLESGCQRREGISQ